MKEKQKKVISTRQKISIAEDARTNTESSFEERATVIEPKPAPGTSAIELKPAPETSEPSKERSNILRDTSHNAITFLFNILLMIFQEICESDDVVELLILNETPLAKMEAWPERTPTSIEIPNSEWIILVFIAFLFDEMAETDEVGDIWELQGSKSSV